MSLDTPPVSPPLSHRRSKRVHGCREALLGPRRRLARRFARPDPSLVLISSCPILYNRSLKSSAARALIGPIPRTWITTLRAHMHARRQRSTSRAHVRRGSYLTRRVLHAWPDPEACRFIIWRAVHALPVARDLAAQHRACPSRRHIAPPHAQRWSCRPVLGPRHSLCRAALQAAA